MKKSENTIGNPYHDDDGKFTTKEGTGSASVNEETPKIKLKKGVDLSTITNAIATNKSTQPATPSKGVDISTPLTMPNSIQDAEMQGNRIIGSNGAVGYAANTDLRVAYEFNKALLAVTTDFPHLFDNEQMYLYGTENKRSYGDKSEVRKEEQNLVSSVLSSPVYISKMQELQMSQDEIMDIMTKALHSSRKKFSKDPNRGCGGFTELSDYNNKAHMLNTHGVIKFNTHYSTDINKWNRYPISSIKTKHFLPIGDKSGAFMVGAHEIGHHVLEKLLGLMKKDEVKKLRDVMWAETKGVMDAHRMHKMGQISGYAMTNRHEHVAEAFANVYCAGPNATQHNKNVVMYLKGVYDRIYGNK